MHDKNNKAVAGRLIVFSGAGLSAESGLPTFRDAGGLWEGHRIEEVADFQTWQANFEKVHAFYNARRIQYAGAQPNAAHLRIAAWARRWPSEIVTQNVDDLLERAGCGDVVHLHGKGWEMRCVACGNVWAIGARGWDCAAEACPRCGEMRWVKPNIVFFNEDAPEYRTWRMLKQGLRAEDAVLVIGTSGTVVPVWLDLMDRPCLKILNNAEPLDSMPEDVFDHAVYGPATRCLDAIERLIEGRLGPGKAV